MDGEPFPAVGSLGEGGRDLKLREKLEPEFSGILNWMIAGALALGEGLGTGRKVCLLLKVPRSRY